MTGDPKRWLSEDGAASSRERALLESVRSVEPPEGVKEQAWHGIVAGLAAGAVVSSVASGTAASSAAAPSVPPALGLASAGAKAATGLIGGTLASKLALVLAGSGVVAAGYFATQGMQGAPRASAPTTARASSTPAAPAPAAPASDEAAPEAVAATLAREPLATESDAVESARPAPALHKAQTRPSRQLSAESALLARSRAALRTGDAVAAERLLQRMGAEFPRGVLGQEREVLTIEVLAARGDAPGAKARARAFAAAYPNSPHLSRLQSLLDVP